MTSKESWKMLGKLRYSEVRKIIMQMDQIPYAILKGEPLSLLCYGQEGERESSDVDFLIEKKNLATFERILCDLDFKSTKQGEGRESRRNRILCLSNSHQIEPYIKRVFNVPILLDINFDIYWGEYTGKKIPIQEVLDNTEEVSVYGINVKTLNPIYSFIQVVLHHYKEMNSLYHLTMHKVITAQRFNEISLLYKELERRNMIESLLELSNQYDLKEYIFYLLHYANRVEKSKTLQNGIELFRTDVGSALLESYGLDEREKKRWEIPFEERINSEKVIEIVKRGLTELDREKIDRSKLIFG